MKNFNTNTQNHDEWLTPPEIIQALGPFDLDPCAPVTRPWQTAATHYTKRDDGLSRPWYGRVWLNPPYGNQTFQWLEKLSHHLSGLALIFARTETRGFHEQVWQKASSVFFFRGRLRFHYVDGSRGGTANAPSVLVAYSREDDLAIHRALERGAITGKHVKL